MLAQSFKTAEELEITQKQFDALAKTLVLMETGKLIHEKPKTFSRGQKYTGHFNMACWNSKNECGTVCCIGGTAELIGNVDFGSMKPMQIIYAGGSTNINEELYELFYPFTKFTNRDGMFSLYPYKNITVEQAATALRSYLTTGKANWEAAVG